jgi:hypothetical protein
MAAVVVGLLGLLIVGGALWATIWRIRFLAGCQRARATVLSITTTADTAGQYDMPVTIYKSHLRFETPAGEAVSFTHEHGTSKPRFAMDDTVSIRYTPGKPAESAEVSSLRFELLVWLSGAIAAGTGGAFLFAAVQMARE